MTQTTCKLTLLLRKKKTQQNAPVSCTQLCIDEIIFPISIPFAVVQHEINDARRQSNGKLWIIKCCLFGLFGREFRYEQERKRARGE